jgi:dTDP-4-amino-4,6-dideoxygalactose transaminase
VAERIGPRTRAIIPVHLAGLPCDMNAIWALANRHRLYVIEDCAHAAGSRYQGWPMGAGNPETGRTSDAAVFSFYATKNLTTGEGGMVTTADDALAEALRLLCLHGINRDAWNRYSDQGNWYYQVQAAGFKYNLSDIQAAIGIHQLHKLEHFIEVRTRWAQLYNELLEDVAAFELPPDKLDCRHAWHLYSLRLNLDALSIGRDEFIRRLREAGIGTSVHFIPIPLHPFFAPYAHKPENQCPNALALYPRLISLPLYPEMTEEQVRYVAETCKAIAARNLKRKVFAAVLAE